MAHVRQGDWWFVIRWQEKGKTGKVCASSPRRTRGGWGLMIDEAPHKASQKSRRAASIEREARSQSQRGPSGTRPSYCQRHRAGAHDFATTSFGAGGVLGGVGGPEDPHRQEDPAASSDRALMSSRVGVGCRTETVKSHPQQRDARRERRRKWRTRTRRRARRRRCAQVSPSPSRKSRAAVMARHEGGPVQGRRWPRAPQATAPPRMRPSRDGRHCGAHEGVQLTKPCRCRLACQGDAEPGPRRPSRTEDPEFAVKILRSIAGPQPVVTRAKKAIANFKLVRD